MIPGWEQNERCPQCTKEKKLFIKHLQHWDFPTGTNYTRHLNPDISGWECVKIAYASAQEANPDN